MNIVQDALNYFVFKDNPKNNNFLVIYTSIETKIDTELSKMEELKLLLSKEYYYLVLIIYDEGKDQLKFEDIHKEVESSYFQKRYEEIKKSIESSEFMGNLGTVLKMRSMRRLNYFFEIQSHIKLDQFKPEYFYDFISFIKN